MSMNDEDVSGLIGRIYDATLDDALWPEVLTELCDAVGGAQVMMGVHDVPRRATAVIAPRMSSEDLASYRDHWSWGDILWQRTNRAPVGQVLVAERYVSREELMRTPLYNDWHRRLGIGAAGLGVNLFVEDGVPALCGIKRPAHRDAFSREETALFAAVAPHLVRAVGIQRRLQKLEIARKAARTIVEAERSCVVAVDANRRMLEADAAAKRILDAGDGLCVDDGRLSARDKAAAAKLNRLIGRCGRGDEAAHAGGAVSVTRGRTRAPLHIEVVPVSARNRGAESGWLGLRSPTAIVAITDPEFTPAIPKYRLIERFALTPAEAELAAELAKGDGRQAAARRLGISVGTVRSHLTRIFEKTGVRRQAELVRLLLDP
ncbi:MAG: helix-turn-helix transcriptional regulator [Dichotomicrobium sp.]